MHAHSQHLSAHSLCFPCEDSKAPSSDYAPGQFSKPVRVPQDPSPQSSSLDDLSPDLQAHIAMSIDGPSSNVGNLFQACKWAHGLKTDSMFRAGEEKRLMWLNKATFIIMQASLTQTLFLSLSLLPFLSPPSLSCLASVVAVCLADKPYLLACMQGTWQSRGPQTLSSSHSGESSSMHPVVFAHGP